jgi:hypothetical protein
MQHFLQGLRFAVKEEKSAPTPGVELNPNLPKESGLLPDPSMKPQLFSIAGFPGTAEEVGCH